MSHNRMPKFIPTGIHPEDYRTLWSATSSADHKKYRETLKEAAQYHASKAN